MKITYNPKLKELSRQLRKNSTLSEVLLWNELKGKKMYGYQFMRQKPILNYIVDFFCSKLKLVIEIDGDSHNHEDAYKADQDRQKEIEKLGIRFLRFDDLDVKHNMSNVLRTIESFILDFEEKGQPPIPLILRGSEFFNWNIPPFKRGLGVIRF
ncbi:endonuclease domain-containing protein [Ekhidna sp.]|jgi:very-short-patch-repair endonuclease|uniref:endonuclease domain-containing protein n=1 Tax=Ekhidna sp. TaxID=2608089 RepID=UPI0032EAA277